MTSSMRTLVAGALLAVAIAALLLALTAGAGNGWKFALAAVGLVLWVVGGLSNDSERA